MFTAKRRIYAAVVAALSMGTMGWASEPTQQDLKIQELQTKVASLEAQQAASSKEMAATIDSVLRDAEHRSQLMATNGDTGAGYDNGFFIRAGDGWVLRPGAQFQFRNITNYRQDVTGTADNNNDEWANGFEIRRMRFTLAGTAFTKDLEYFFQWDSNRDSGTTSLLEAWTKYMFADDWGMRAGQFKDPVSHEFLNSTSRMLAVENSLVDNLIGGGVGGFTQGVTLIYGGYNKNNPLNVEVGLTDGANQLNTNFTGRPVPDTGATLGGGAPGAHTVDFGVAGRVEYKAMGDWANYKDFTAMGTKNDLLVIGAGGDWTQAGDDNLLLGTVDAQYESASGLGLYGAAIIHYLDSGSTSGGSSSTTDWGLLAQASYMLNPQWEVFGRYDVTFFDNPQIADEDTFHEFTIGANYYLGTNGSAGHRAKITLDLTYLPNGAPVSATGLGILDANEAHAEWIMRAQFQLLI